MSPLCQNVRTSELHCIDLITVFVSWMLRKCVVHTTDIITKPLPFKSKLIVFSISVLFYFRPDVINS